MSNAVALMPPVAKGFNDEQIALIKQTIAKGATDTELALFVAQCNRTGLDPFARQIYFIKRGGVAKAETSIDGFRVIAERTGEMDGSESFWCGEDGVWKDVWLAKEPPAAAKTIVYRKGCEHSFVAVARFAEYCVPGSMWSKMPSNQIAKCSESLALRKAFPHQLSGLYTKEEMGQADGAMEPLVVEAPKSIDAPGRPPLPEGHFYVLRVIPKQFGGDIEVVDGAGETTIYPVPDRQCITLAEQIAQEGVPVALERVRGPRTGTVKVKAIHRYKTPEQVAAENAAIDAQLVQAEQVL